jgi:hypothetical protein
MVPFLLVVTVMLVTRVLEYLEELKMAGRTIVLRKEPSEERGDRPAETEEGLGVQN